MNKISTIIIIAAIIFVLYYFRDKIRKLFAPDVQIVINGSQPRNTTTPACNCSAPDAGPVTEQEQEQQETGEYMPEDLLDILYPTSNWSSGSIIYSGSNNL